MNMNGGKVDKLDFSKEDICGTLGSLSKQFEHFRPSACAVAEKCLLTMSCKDRDELDVGIAILRILSDSIIGAGNCWQEGHDVALTSTLNRY